MDHVNYINSILFFDRRDHQLLTIVNDVLNREASAKDLKKLLYPYLHPHGIKEMASSKGLRIAYAVLHLLESMEMGKAEDRLSALRSLQDEVTNSADSSLRRNTARVLLQMMKELVRAHGHYRRQLELAHDFRSAASGKPRIIRKQLKKYHLLEMPEEWNQVAFDDHVHDASTKGRKSPSHLIMDAWIKGIRHLTVIYYNYVRPAVASELLEAARIMEMNVRIGVEFSANFRGRYIQLIWGPQGFLDAQDFLCFLAEESIETFMEGGRKVSDYQQRHVMRVFEAFNSKHRHSINQTYGLNLAPFNQEDFFRFVGAGQASLLHLAEFVHANMLVAMRGRLEELRDEYQNATVDERQRIIELVEDMNGLDSETILERYLRPACNPDIPDPAIPADGPDVPELLKQSPQSLLNCLIRLHSTCRVTLNLSHLTLADVLELLYDCEGKITHLEIFNLKDYVVGKTAYNKKINDLQRALNSGNVITLKRMIREIINDLESMAATPAEREKNDERVEKFKHILNDIAAFSIMYKEYALKACVGSDSTGRSHYLHGMGLVVRETLPYKVQKELRKLSGHSRLTIPVRIDTYLTTTYIPHSSSNFFYTLLNYFMRHFPVLQMFFQECRKDWVVRNRFTCLEEPGNLISLGGVSEDGGNGLYLDAPSLREQEQQTVSWQYLNTGLKNGLKVLIGFIPAFATFLLTKDWWFLAYFGAFIWFGITGFRNILQSVLGGGGIRRAPMLGWNDYVCWERITDSLLYTGFSVPLLDYVVKTLLLNDIFDINTSTNPGALYGYMALANGIYISSHNTLRGLPPGAVFGNFFRSILSIPIAILFNLGIGGMLNAGGIANIDAILQKWAAVISKAASDCVAGIIEGAADRYNNIRIRLRDYKSKFKQMLEVHAHMELLFPQTDVLDMIVVPDNPAIDRNDEARDLEKIMIINALDLLYFWMYQPRSRSALRLLLPTLSREERQILLRSQFVLTRYREISQLFVDGLIGKNFSKALAFYLNRSEEYLKMIREMGQIP